LNRILQKIVKFSQFLQAFNTNPQSTRLTVVGGQRQLSQNRSGEETGGNCVSKPVNDIVIAHVEDAVRDLIDRLIQNDRNSRIPHKDSQQSNTEKFELQNSLANIVDQANKLPFTDNFGNPVSIVCSFEHCDEELKCPDDMINHTLKAHIHMLQSQLGEDEKNIQEYVTEKAQKMRFNNQAQTMQASSSQTRNKMHTANDSEKTSTKESITDTDPTQSIEKVCTLINDGNLCYLNTNLQFLRHTEQFRSNLELVADALDSTVQASESSVNFTIALHKFFKQMDSSTRMNANPSLTAQLALTTNVGKIGKDVICYTPGVQHDAQEIFQRILETIDHNCKAQ